MKKTFCDRCGEEIPEESLKEFYERDKDAFYIVGARFNAPPDLCVNCIKALQEFLKNGGAQL